MVILLHRILASGQCAAPGHYEEEDRLMKYVITEKRIREFREQLCREEKGEATIKKYMRDLYKLVNFADGRSLDKELVVAYKKELKESGRYKTRSINSYLVAANRFFSFMGWHELRVKTYKVQRETFRPENRNFTKRDYKKLVAAAKKAGNLRLALLIQTICAVGLRVSELQMVTVDAVKKGVAQIRCKGKERQVLLPRSLQKHLLYYIRKKGICQGIVFCTSSGRPLDRSNIWKEMKALCGRAGVDRDKVFPHNLRHLFAVTFYEMSRDIGMLADILGHGSIETTRIYIKTSSCEYRERLDKMDLVFW